MSLYAVYAVPMRSIMRVIWPEPWWARASGKAIALWALAVAVRGIA